MKFVPIFTILLVSALSAAAVAEESLTAKVTDETRAALIADVMVFDVAEEDATVIVDCSLDLVDETAGVALDAAQSAAERDAIMAEAVDMEALFDCAGDAMP